MFAHYLRVECCANFGDRDLAIASSEYTECVQIFKNPFVCDVLLYKLQQESLCVKEITLPVKACNGRPSQLETMRSKPSKNCGFDKEEFSQELIHSAVEILSTFYQSFVDDIPNSMCTHIPTIIEAVATYKSGFYARTSLLCRQIIEWCTEMQGAGKYIASISTDPPYTVLLDDDFCCLIGLSLLLNPGMRFFNTQLATLVATYMPPDTMARYLMLRIMMKQNSPVDEISAELHRLAVWINNLGNNDGKQVLVRPLLYFVYRKALQFIRRRHCYK